VRSGRLTAGTALPSSRALARDLGVARNTVVDAYGQLVAEGWLASRHGSGTWVAERPKPGPAAPPGGAQRAAAVRYDLRPGSPDLSAFPRAAWLAASRRALGTAPASALGYSDPRGLEVLRVALAGYLARARGVIATPDRIVVCAGFVEGLQLLCEVLHAGGARTLAVEAYGQAVHRHIATSAGLRLVTLEVDAHGAVLDSLSADGRRAGATHPGAVLLTPAHQFPLGVALVPHRRRLVVDWAAQTGGLVIEDDYDGEFRYDRQAVGALQALAPEQVVYVGTASKSLAPGLRLGWLVLPDELARQVADRKRSAVRLSSGLDQLALAEFISSGAYDRQIRRARLAYRQRRDRLVAALAREVPAVRVTGIAAGLHVLVRLPAGQQEHDLIARAVRHGLALEGLSALRAGGQQVGPAVVVGYATPPAHAFSSAVARLCAALGAS
jgi:GntR family transcriptional regulator/MocR family aminotransferase